MRYPDVRTQCSVRIRYCSKLKSFILKAADEGNVQLLPVKLIPVGTRGTMSGVHEHEAALTGIPGPAERGNSIR